MRSKQKCNQLVMQSADYVHYKDITEKCNIWCNISRLLFIYDITEIDENLSPTKTNAKNADMFV